VKRLMVALALLLSLLTPAVYAQNTTNDETVTVKKSDLTKDQLAQIQQQAVADKVRQYGSWVGVGHEIGTAVNESLSAVTNQANSFSNTSVGKWTIFLVIWKVAGHDIIGFFVGFFLLTVGIPVWTFAFYRNCITRRVLVSKTKDERKWEVVNDGPAISRGDLSDLTLSRIFHFVALAVFGAFTAWVMFA
jgi:hypothetical protein